MTGAPGAHAAGALAGVLLPMRPHLVEKVWGGTELHQRGKVKASDGLDTDHVGEAWEVADLPGGQSVVAAGPFAGAPLGDVVRQHARALVGRLAPTESAFPLLVKLIDASADLSVQVHPNASQAAERAGAAPKDECWLVLGAKPGAKLAHGFGTDDVTEESFRRALEAKTPLSSLRFVEVTPGDILRVSPGTVHAIGQGVFLLEVQEPSDTTYRVWDYERRGLDGQLRDLHLEDALAVLRYGPQAPALVEPSSLESMPAGASASLLVDAPRYRLEVLNLDASRSASFETDGDTPLTLTVLEGSGTVATPTQEVSFSALQSVVVPATCGVFAISADERTKIAVAGLPASSLLVPSTHEASPS